MPIYEYRCESCSTIHEMIQKFSDPPLSSCPKCESPVSKLMSLGAFALKGTGFYTTDYKRKSSPSSTENKATAPSTGETCGAGACGKPECAS